MINKIRHTLARASAAAVLVAAVTAPPFTGNALAQQRGDTPAGWYDDELASQREFQDRDYRVRDDLPYRDREFRDYRTFDDDDFTRQYRAEDYERGDHVIWNDEPWEKDWAAVRGEVDDDLDWYERGHDWYDVGYGNEANWPGYETRYADTWRDDIWYGDEFYDYDQWGYDYETDDDWF